MVFEFTYGGELYMRMKQIVIYDVVCNACVQSVRTNINNLTLYRRLNHGKRLVFFDYLGVFKTTKGPGASADALFGPSCLTNRGLFGPTSIPFLLRLQNPLSVCDWSSDVCSSDLFFFTEKNFYGNFFFYFF